MKKHNAFTVYELLISITLLSIIIVSLTRVIFNVRDMQAKAQIEYEMKAYRGLVINEIEKDINTIGVYDINSCVDERTKKCLSFDFDSTLKELEVDVSNSLIKYNGINYTLPTNAYFSDIDNIKTTISEYIVASGFNKVLTIYIPLKHYELDDDYSIQIIIQYNDERTPYTNTEF